MVVDIAHILHYKHQNTHKRSLDLEREKKRKQNKWKGPEFRKSDQELEGKRSCPPYWVAWSTSLFKGGAGGLRGKRCL